MKPFTPRRPGAPTPGASVVALAAIASAVAVSYTHLTLPTILRV